MKLKVTTADTEENLLITMRNLNTQKDVWYHAVAPGGSLEFYLQDDHSFTCVENKEIKVHEQPLRKS